MQAGKRRLDLAMQLGVSEETIRLWEKGSVQPSADRLARLIAVLSLETSEWSAPADPAIDLPPLAQRLRNERQGRGLTQATVVKILGVPQATYAGWETGRSTPGPQLFGNLADFLGIAERDVATLCATPFIVDTAGWPPFGQFVGARRQELRLTRAGLAEALGVSQGTIVAWELGYRAPASAHLTALARRAVRGSGVPRRRAAEARRVDDARRADPVAPARARVALGRPRSPHRYDGSDDQSLGQRTESTGADEPRASRRGPENAPRKCRCRRWRSDVNEMKQVPRSARRRGRSRW